MTKIHLDTDIGGDMDDLCALAMLLKLPDVQLTGVTTVAEEHGRRAGYVRYVLDLMGRSDVPFAAGADTADGIYRYPSLGYPPDEVNYPEPVPPVPGHIDAALDLLKRSIEQDALIVGIGPFTNLRLLDEKYPGILRDARLFLMGVYVDDVPPGYPDFARTDDWNVQVDVSSALHVLEHADPTCIPITVTAQTALRRADIPRLQSADQLGELLARQADAFWEEWHNGEKFAQYEHVPDDMINFHHDPLACAIALGWSEGVTVERVPLTWTVRDTYLYETRDPQGKPINLVTSVDGAAFNRYWLEVICGGTSGKIG